MNYELVVKAAWANDPQFQTLCKTLWGEQVTPEQVIEFSKDGPDAADVHVPGNGGFKRKRKGQSSSIPVMDNRALPVQIEKDLSPTYSHLPKANREYKRDDHGRFASVGHVLTNAGIAGGATVGSGLLGSAALGQAKGLWGRIGAEGVTAAEIGGRATKLGVLGAGAALAGAVAGFHGREAYEETKDHLELEREHARHVAERVRGDDAHTYTTGDGPHDLHVITRGRRRDAVSNVKAEGADSTVQSYKNLEVERELRRKAPPADALNYYAHYRQTHPEPQTNPDKYRAANQVLRAHPVEEPDDDAYTRDYDRMYAVHKAAASGTLSHFDNDRRQVFGWASIVQKDGLPVVDLQGDYITIEELEKAAYDYVHHSRVGGDMHDRVDETGTRIRKSKPYHAADLIESFVVTPEKIEKMGLPASTPVGWWVGFQVNDPATWTEVREGRRAGFSIHGAGRRQVIGEVDNFTIDGAELT